MHHGDNGELLQRFIDRHDAAWLEVKSVIASYFSHQAVRLEDREEGISKTLVRTFELVTKDDFVLLKSLQAFAWGVARNVHREMWKPQPRPVPVDEAALVEDPAPGPDRIAACKAFRDHWAAVVNELSPALRSMMVLLVENQDMTTCEIADHLGISTTVAAVRVCDARKRLRSYRDRQSIALRRAA